MDSFIRRGGNRQPPFPHGVPYSGLVSVGHPWGRRGWGAPCQHKLLVAHPGGWNWVGGPGAQRAPLQAHGAVFNSLEECTLGQRARNNL